MSDDPFSDTPHTDHAHRQLGKTASHGAVPDPIAHVAIGPGDVTQQCQHHAYRQLGNSRGRSVRSVGHVNSPSAGRVQIHAVQPYADARDQAQVRRRIHYLRRDRLRASDQHPEAADQLRQLLLLEPAAKGVHYILDASGFQKIERLPIHLPERDRGDENTSFRRRSGSGGCSGDGSVWGLLWWRSIRGFYFGEPSAPEPLLDCRNLPGIIHVAIALVNERSDSLCSGIDDAVGSHGWLRATEETGRTQYPKERVWEICIRRSLRREFSVGPKIATFGKL